MPRKKKTDVPAKAGAKSYEKIIQQLILIPKQSDGENERSNHIRNLTYNFLSKK